MVGKHTIHNTPDERRASHTTVGLRALPLAMVLAYAATPDIASAQNTGQDEATQLAPVVVYGTTGSSTGGTGAYTATGPSSLSSGLDLTLRETPQSVSVITSQRMQDQNLTQLTDVANQTPGLVVSQGGNVGSDSSPIYARGFAIDTYMIDGTRMTGSYSSIYQSQDMSLYDRVEVVRGAAGMMNGVGAPGGAINMVRKKPFDDFRASATVDLGSWRSRRGSVDLSTPLNETGSVRARMVATLQDSDAYIDRFNDRRKVFYGVVEADLGSATVLRGGISHQRHDLTGHSRGGLPAYASDGERLYWSRSDSAAADWASSRRHETSLFADLEHRFANGWQLRLNAGHTITDSDELVGYVGGTPDRHTGAGANIWATHWVYKPKQDALNLAANGSFSLFGREHEAAFGANWSRTRYESPSYTNWSHAGWDQNIPDIFNWDGSYPAEPYNPAVGTHGIDERNNGLFGSLRLRPADALAVIVGTRWVDWRRDQLSYNYASGVNSGILRAERKFVPYAAVTYDLSDQWTAYTSYTTIFTPQNNMTVDGDYIDPLSGESYEAGVKAAFFDERLNLGAALYQIRENNKAIAIPDTYAPDGSQAYEAVSGARTRGFEIELSGQVRPGWEIAASFARNSTQDREGERINTNLPQSMAKLFTTYRMDGLVDGLTLGGGVRWQSKIYSENQGPNQDATFTQPAYAVVDLLARYDISPRLSTALHVYNLFDKSYYLSTGSSYYGSPRAFVVSLTGRY
ncbi:TonB-dependent siderophore receptor [Verticiella sediminum]|uniref:TonB-dependent siderophore receptor n=1 Tax=Verticiella sediminum TaxID=1247510 RepID=A0A556AWQ4_9BURK|nr:TonB-dependent siderophore receptor [Verticiella sediminum]TSH97360.1 TonB-dependent siderophore receptor [Verticiella sediminum]